MTHNSSTKASPFKLGSTVHHGLHPRSWCFCTAAILSGFHLGCAHPSKPTPEGQAPEEEPIPSSKTSEESAKQSDAPKDSPGTSEPSESGTSGSQNSDAEPGSDLIEPIQIKTKAWTFDALAAGPEHGELVLLLHGFPETSLEWTEQLKALGLAGFRAVAPDQRGYSPTARPKEIAAYRNAELVQDVLEMADALGAAQFHLVGHDWGAGVAWGFAAQHPERLHSLAPISVPHPDAFNEQLRDKSSCQYEASSYFDLFVQPNFEDTLLAFNATGLRNTYEGLPPDRVEAYVQALGTKEALGAGLNWYRANIKDRVTVDPPTGPVKVPTRFIWSDKDKAICKEGADATKNYVSAKYELFVLEGINHWVPELAAQRVSDLLLEHVRAN